jgi:anti-anti-sigma regulatory factor
MTLAHSRHATSPAVKSGRREPGLAVDVDGNTIRVRGRIDVLNVDLVLALAGHLAERGRKMIVLDLTDVQVVHAAALRALRAEKANLDHAGTVLLIRDPISS